MDVQNEGGVTFAQEGTSARFAGTPRRQSAWDFGGTMQSGPDLTTGEQAHGAPQNANSGKPI
ncbi:hypothetical protein [Burkholderia sp. WAC0059]|uniref:hypothetical protein n=1 Tax=Burkholderia sp. WAC0059 TaxID=2066022 RepID=UPI0011AF1937|nr:hypothetical protein [Burkholderia sp. WAC0059]